MTEPPIHAAGDEAPAHPRHTGNRWFDLIAALTAIFISAVSLFVAIEHGRTERDLVQANSWPFVQAEIDNSYHGDETIGLYNAGVGPAKLETLELFYRGQPVPTVLDLLRRCCGLSDRPDMLRRQLPRGLGFGQGSNLVLRPGEHANILTVRYAEPVPDLYGRFPQAGRSITYRACYCSVFDQCWISNLTDLHPRPVSECPVPAHPLGMESPS